MIRYHTCAVWLKAADSFLILIVHILSAEQIRAWDQYTIQHEPISSVDLMERAAQKCVDWLTARQWSEMRFLIFCGKGNNGGDGLAIARMLITEGYDVSIYILEFGKLGSGDFQTNLERLHYLPNIDLHFVQASHTFPYIGANNIVIDALFGFGLSKALEGLSTELVRHINQSKAAVVSIDLPSGLFSDQSSKENVVIEADHTLTFQCFKLGLLVQENAPFIGEVQVLDIGLKTEFLRSVPAAPRLLDEKQIRTIYKPRERFAHKGTYGHALVVGGSYGKMGAVVLAAKACLRCGAGLTTALIPQCGNVIMQSSAPEAMAIIDEEEKYLSNLPDDVERFSAIGIGPGMGTAIETQKLLSFVIRRYTRPLVVDADGLNCLSLNKEWLEQLPSDSILTPHPKEFDRLFGEHRNDFERIEKAKYEAKRLNVIIVLKGHHTLIAMPDGHCYFNSTGNAGIAKGGSGDVLTGMLTSLLAQAYSPRDAALLGVYMHGWAGDIAARKHSQEAMLPSDLIECLPDVFLALQA